jgi:protein gp37
MSNETKIQWCDATFNAWIGCTKVSPGCAHCYAVDSTPTRVLRSAGHETWGLGATRHRTGASTWRQPMTWARKHAEAINDYEGHKTLHGGFAHYAEPHRPRVFCASLADVFDAEVEAAWLSDLLALIRVCCELDWLLLTKRPELWRERMQAVASLGDIGGQIAAEWLSGRPLSNIWIGTTVEDQARADARREPLRVIPAAVHFVSYEPALEQVNFTGWEFLDWLIMGGESGPAARSCQVEWYWETLYWCRGANVAPFVKQLGAAVFTQNANAMDWPEETVFTECGEQTAAGARVVLNDKKGGDLAEFPAELQVREFPKP